jgi:hypothetical protein
MTLLIVKAISPRLGARFRRSGARGSAAELETVHESKAFHRRFAAKKTSTCGR